MMPLADVIKNLEKWGQQGNGPKSNGIFGNLLKANYIMNLFEIFKTFYWIFNLYEYLFLNEFKANL